MSKASDCINRICTALITFLLAAMSVVVFVQVVFRFIGKSIPWSEEFARYSMVYITFLGAAVCVKNKSLISIVALMNMFPKKLQHFLEIVITIGEIVMFAVILHYGVILTQRTMSQASSAMRIPMGFIYVSIVIGSLIIIFQLIVHIVENIKSIYARGGESK